MKRITYTVDCYEYPELSPEAKENVHRWFLDDPFRTDDFTDMVKSDVSALLEPVEFNVQYSLAYCQGDGLNVSGRFNVEGFRNGSKNAPLLPWPEYSEKEWRTLQHYNDICGPFTIPQNRHYCYCMYSSIDFADNWISELEDQCYSGINRPLIRDFESKIKVWHKAFCKEWEEIGYKYFYEADPEEVAEMCAANNWYFDIDGNFLPGV